MTPRPFRKVLVANRGEIAVRVIRACRDLRLATVAVFSECDKGAPHVRMADQAICLGASEARESYLNIERVIDAARRTGADAIHPGYGFLAENEDFAAAVRDAGFVFIGPTPEAIARMGSKTAARNAAVAAGVPVVPGTDGPVPDDLSDEALTSLAANIGYPLVVKAVAGGGGKGMRSVLEPSALLDAVRSARSEADSAFGDAAIYLERRLERARHIEIQILADHHGSVVAFVERECSVQRRHQKVVEESPSPSVSPSLRAAMADASIRLARRVGYTNAGTLEFLVDDTGQFYFLEMNTRLQVEHPVTEAVTGVDIVCWQLAIAMGHPLTVDPEQARTPNGHAIECRVYAEDPDQGFLPSPGLIVALRAPSGPGVRDDSGAEAGFRVPIHYDPMISKLIVWAPDRKAAIARMKRALAEYLVVGVKTTLPFFRWLLDQPVFIDARIHTAYLDDLLCQHPDVTFSAPRPDHEDVALIAALIQATSSSEANPASVSVPPSAWQYQARTEGLR